VHPPHWLKLRFHCCRRDASSIAMPNVLGARERVWRIDPLCTASSFSWLLFPVHDHPCHILSRPEWISHPRTGCQVKYEEVYELISALHHVIYRFSGDDLSSLPLSMRSATALLFRALPFLAVITRSRSWRSGSGMRGPYQRCLNAEAVEDLTWAPTSSRNSP